MLSLRSFGGFVISAVAGGSGLESVAAMAGSLSALSYRRADELEAEREGIRLLEAARGNPMGVVEIMQLLLKQGADEARFVRYLSSHPQTALRVAELETLARASRVAPVPVMCAAAWQEVRRMCS